MLYLSISYNYSPDFNSPESWLKRAEIYTGILEYLSKEHTVINIKQINYEGICNHNGVEHHFVSFSKKKTHFPWQLNRYIAGLKPDVVIVQGLHHPLQLIQLRILLNKKTKIIAHHHAEKPFTGIKKQAQRIADKFIDAYLFAAHEMGMDWVKKGNVTSSRKVHEVMEVSSLFYPVNKAIAKEKTGIKGDPIFLWVGRLNENKDPLNVVKAFLKFAGTAPSAYLYMIYQTNELLADIKKTLDGHENKKAIILTGKVEHNELLYWFNSADFIISGSHYEGSGTAICEAMSCGCIPIVTDIFSFRMITDNGRCGILYEPGNEAALLTALIQSQTINLQEKRNTALDYFKSTLSFEAIAEKIHSIASSL
jgi:glycosyltransferase involved in cell wall biosynthesis